MPDVDIGTLRRQVEHALGSDVAHMQPLSGGDVAAAYRTTLADGRVVFAKAAPAQFSTEAAGLRWLAEGPLRVPAVLACADPSPGEPGYLVLEWIDTGAGPPADDERFGRDLAALHALGAPSFGREDRRTTGSRRLPNEPVASWAELYGGQRLAPLARLARDAGALPAATITRLEQLAADVGRFDTGEPPARVHGDLWAGNRLVDRRGESWLIDPAAHGGHREADLAMMRLFGGFSERCFAAYDEAWPLAAGWHERVALHQIAPLAVHAIKFGGGYVRAAVAAIERCS
jgi:fructosamine-3-kinase